MPTKKAPPKMPMKPMSKKEMEKMMDDKKKKKGGK